MRMRPLLLLSIVAGGCFAEGPEGQNPTGDDDTTGTSGTSMTATASASTTTMDPVTTTPTSEATGMTDPTDTMTTDGPTTDETTTSVDTGPDPDSSSTGEPPIEEDVIQDFLVEAADAGWTNDMGAVLDFPVYPEDAAAPSGHAFLASQSHMVSIDSTGDVFVDEAMVLHPRYVPDGEVRGRYGGRTYMAGDTFRTHAYCVEDTSCSVTLAIGQSIKQSAPAIVQMWPISVNDADGVEIDFELMGGGFTPGVVTELSLIVMAGPDSASDSLLLDRPRIVRP